MLARISAQCTPQASRSNLWKRIRGSGKSRAVSPYDSPPSRAAGVSIVDDDAGLEYAVGLLESALDGKSTDSIRHAIAVLQRLRTHRANAGCDEPEQVRVVRVLANTVRESKMEIDADMEGFLLSRAVPSFLGRSFTDSNALHGNTRPSSMPRSPSPSAVVEGTAISPPPDWSNAWNAAMRTEVDRVRSIHLGKAALEDWTYDVQQLDESSEGRCLSLIFLEVVRRRNLCQRLDEIGCNIAVPKLVTFLRQCEAGYGDNAYHNRKHAADVLLGMHRFLHESPCSADKLHDHQHGARWSFSAVEEFSALFAAAMHDFQHPGTNNAHEIRKDSALAVRYHDESVLENHHLAASFTSLLRPEYNFLKAWGRKEYAEFRALVVKLVLMTDLSKHFEFVEDLKASEAGSLMPPPPSIMSNTCSEQEVLDVTRVLTVGIKMADLGHTIKPFTLHERWSRLITEEFHALGDAERAAGLPISTLCDRHKDTDIAKSQLGFLRIVCRPFYAAVARALPGQEVALARLDANINEWEALK